MGTSRTMSSVARAALAAGLVLVGLAVTTAPAGAEDGAPSAVTITQTPSGATTPCVPPPLGLTYTTENTPESFTLRIVAASAPCSPIEAKAVVYAMPTTGEQWPQTLSEAVPFTISEAGVTEVVFAKGCEPVQFDVLTGATPAVISPLGEWHGPLLFPFDTATSLQWFGDPSCNPTTTTSTTTSTPEVIGSTTVPIVSSTTPPEVAAETTVPTNAPAVAGTTQQPAALALTGRTNGWVALAGTSLVLAGAAMLLVSRRRTQVEGVEG